jgi:hypothetical protein
MTRDELWNEYENETSNNVPVQRNTWTKVYITWLEDQLIAPCKSCQNLQGQVFRQEVRIRELEDELAKWDEGGLI